MLIFFLFFSHAINKCKRRYKSSCKNQTKNSFLLSPFLCACLKIKFVIIFFLYSCWSCGFGIRYLRGLSLYSVAKSSKYLRIWQHWFSYYFFFCIFFALKKSFLEVNPWKGSDFNLKGKNMSLFIFILGILIVLLLRSNFFFLPKSPKRHSVHDFAEKVAKYSCKFGMYMSHWSLVIIEI